MTVLIVVALLGCGDTGGGDSGDAGLTGSTPAGTPGGTTGAGSTPAGTTPTGSTPTGSTPTGTTPTGSTPTGTTSTGTTPTGSTSTGPDWLSLCVNEFMPDNGGSHEVDGEAPDWIELHNPGPDPVDLMGWQISDTTDDPAQHTFVDPLTVPAGGFLLLYADEATELGPSHLPFRLSGDGEAVVLRDPWGHTSVIRYDAIQADVAAARTSDCCEGACWGFPFIGTPGVSNIVPDPPVRVDEVVLAAGGTWRWWTGEDAPDADWFAGDFDDSSWTADPGPLGYGDGHIVSVLPYGPDGANKWPAAYFRYSFDVESPEQVQTLVLELLRDDGALVRLNGVELVRTNLPFGAIEHGTRALSAMGGADETTYTPTDHGPDGLVEGRNVLAVELHQATAGSSDLGFDLTLMLERLVPAD